MLKDSCITNNIGESYFMMELGPSSTHYIHVYILLVKIS